MLNTDQTGEAIREFGKPFPFHHPPLCAGCLGDVGLAPTGDVACLSCGLVILAKASLERAIRQ